MNGKRRLTGSMGESQTTHRAINVSVLTTLSQGQIDQLESLPTRNPGGGRCLPLEFGHSILVE